MVWAHVPIYYKTSYDKCRDSELTIFTDGSRMEDETNKNKKNVGFGWAAFTGGKEVATRAEPLGEMSSVPLAELEAIRDALTWVGQHSEYHNLKIRIVSDSMSTLQSLNRRLQNTELYLCTKTMAAELIKKGIKLSLHWTKAHVDTLGNEAADKLAKAGTAMPFLGHTKPVLSVARAKKEINESFTSAWTNQWIGLDSCRVARDFFQRPNSSIYKFIKALSIKETRNFIEFTTGHGNFRTTLRHYGWAKDVTCRFCGKGRETSWHIWQWCDSFGLLQQMNLIRNSMRKETSYNDHLSNIATFVTDDRIQRLLNDVLPTGIG